MSTPSSSTDAELLVAFRERVRAVIRRRMAEEHAEAEARRARVLPLLRDVVAAARAEGLCGGVVLFGSYAWGRPGEGSDVDILVDGGDVDAVAERVGAATRLMVHALAMQEAPVSLRERALRDSVPL